MGVDGDLNHHAGEEDGELSELETTQTGSTRLWSQPQAGWCSTRSRQLVPIHASIRLQWRLGSSCQFSVTLSPSGRSSNRVRRSIKTSSFQVPEIILTMSVHIGHWGESR